MMLNMLAWVFWHARDPRIPEEEYVLALTAFHELIREISPQGFLGIRTLRYDARPWLPAQTEVHEDWYFVRDSAALDVLEDAAVSAFANEAHGRIARLTLTAIAGLYRLRAGEPAARTPHCRWIDKPRGEPYPTFLESFRDADAVWSRQMVLGPTPEFCIEER